MSKNNRTFITASIIAVGLFLAVLLTLSYLLKLSDLAVYNLISVVLLISVILLMIMVILSIASIITAYSISNKPIAVDGTCRNTGTITQKYLKLNYWIVRDLLMPLFEQIAQIFNLDKEHLERFFIDFNNKIVNSMNIQVASADMIIILPHCLQNSTCSIKVTNDINNCRRCGKCDIGKVAELSEKWGIQAVVVTGGTAARARLKQVKPKAVISVACERDLSSGIHDVRNIPIAGILNMRPNGPCCNTKVDVDEIAKAVEKMVVSNYITDSTHYKRYSIF